MGNPAKPRPSLFREPFGSSPDTDPWKNKEFYSSTPRESLGRRGGACPTSLSRGSGISSATGVARKTEDRRERSPSSAPPPFVSPGILTWRETLRCFCRFWGGGGSSKAPPPASASRKRRLGGSQTRSASLHSSLPPPHPRNCSGGKGRKGKGQKKKQEKGARGRLETAPPGSARADEPRAFVPDFLGKSCHAGRPGSFLTSAGQMWRSPALLGGRGRGGLGGSLSRSEGRGQPVPPRWRRAVGGVTPRRGEKRAGDRGGSESFRRSG